MRRPKLAFFDLEILYGPDQLSPDNPEKGWGMKDQMGVSFGAVYICDDDPWSGTNHPFVCYEYPSLDLLAEPTERMERMILSADRVVSYNGISFDVPVLKACGVRFKRGAEINEHVDLYLEIRNGAWPLYSGIGLWDGLKLGEISLHTLGMRKIDKGELAPLLAQQGEIERLQKYGLHDVYPLLVQMYFWALWYGFVIGRWGPVPVSLPGGVPAAVPQKIVGKSASAQVDEEQIGIIKELCPTWEKPTILTARWAQTFIHALEDWRSREAKAKKEVAA